MLLLQKPYSFLRSPGTGELADIAAAKQGTLLNKARRQNWLLSVACPPQAADVRVADVTIAIKLAEKQ